MNCDILRVFATLYIKTALEFVSFETGYNKSYIKTKSGMLIPWGDLFVPLCVVLYVYTYTHLGRAVSKGI